MERITAGFGHEAGAAGDVGAALLGRLAGEGMHLLALLGRKYAVVCTNPPYMGSKNMDATLKRYMWSNTTSRASATSTLLSLCVV